MVTSKKNGEKLNSKLHHICILNLSASARWVTMSIFMRSLAGLNSKFSFSQTGCHTIDKDPSLVTFLSIAGARTVKFIPFPIVLKLCEMQAALSRVRTLVTLSNSNEGNHYSIGTSTHTHTHIYIYLKLATIVEGDQKAPFSIATTLRCRGGRYSFLWIAPLYPWYVPYIAEC